MVSRCLCRYFVCATEQFFFSNYVNNTVQRANICGSWKFVFIFWGWFKPKLLENKEILWLSKMTFPFQIFIFSKKLFFIFNERQDRLWSLPISISSNERPNEIIAQTDRQTKYSLHLKLIRSWLLGHGSIAIFDLFMSMSMSQSLKLFLSSIANPIAITNQLLFTLLNSQWVFSFYFFHFNINLLNIISRFYHILFWA